MITEKGFDSEKYLKLQSEHISERISKFGKLTSDSAENYLMIFMHHAYCPDLNLITNLRCSNSLKIKLR